MLDRAIIEARLRRLPEVEQQLASPSLMSQPKALREAVREHAALRKTAEKAELFFRLEREVREHRALLESDDADPDLKHLAREELGDLERALAAAEADLSAALLPPDPRDERNAILEIRAGTGGEEAALFAADLLRMYTRYAERQGWKVTPIDLSPSDLGGFKEAICTVEGSGAYGRLRYESGGHRVQRVPTTESQGRIHTSAATVAVFPEADEEDDLVIPPEDLRVDIFCASGPGGQGVNTTYSAVRVTHLPTGLSVQSQDERSQHRNKEKALRVLKARLLDQKRREEEERMGAERRSLIGSGDRSERIRTYNFPQNRVTDHRIGLTLYTLDRVMEGDLDDILSALRAHDTTLRLQGLAR